MFRLEKKSKYFVRWLRGFTCSLLQIHFTQLQIHFTQLQITSRNSKFTSRNSKFTSRNSEFTSRNSKFISRNSEFTSRILVMNSFKFIVIISGLVSISLVNKIKVIYLSKQSKSNEKVWPK